MSRSTSEAETTELTTDSSVESRNRRRRGRRQDDRQRGLIERTAKILGLEPHELVRRASMSAPGADLPEWLHHFPRWSDCREVGLNRVAAQTQWVESAEFELRQAQVLFPDVDILAAYRAAYRWEESSFGTPAAPDERATFLRQWVARVSTRVAAATQLTAERSLAGDAVESAMPSDSASDLPTGEEEPVEPLPEARPSLTAESEPVAERDAIVTSGHRLEPGAEVIVQVSDPGRLYQTVSHTLVMSEFGGYEDGGWIYEWLEPPRPGAASRLLFDGQGIVQPAGGGQP